jgi:hypothetical protein
MTCYNANDKLYLRLLRLRRKSENLPCGLLTYSLVSLQVLRLFQWLTCLLKVKLSIRLVKNLLDNGTAGHGPRNGDADPCLASSSALSFPSKLEWPGIHKNLSLLCRQTALARLRHSSTSLDSTTHDFIADSAALLSEQMDTLLLVYPPLKQCSRVMRIANISDWKTETFFPKDWKNFICGVWQYKIRHFKRSDLPLTDLCLSIVLLLEKQPRNCPHTGVFLKVCQMGLKI